MPSLKYASAKLTSEYVRMLGEEARLKELGGDALVREINLVNKIRAEINMADEVIKRRLQLNPEVQQDPDSDCRG